jgi:hypothetical protein
MKRIFGVATLIVIFAVSLCADAAWPKPFSLQGTYSRDTVKKDCDGAGGTFTDTANGGYGCTHQVAALFVARAGSASVIARTARHPASSPASRTF